MDLTQVDLISKDVKVVDAKSENLSVFEHKYPTSYCHLFNYILFTLDEEKVWRERYV